MLILWDSSNDDPAAPLSDKVINHLSAKLIDPFDTLNTTVYHPKLKLIVQMTSQWSSKSYIWCNIFLIHSKCMPHQAVTNLCQMLDPDIFLCPNICNYLDLTFNENGVFMGTLTKAVDPPPSAEREIDNWSMTHSTFFAALLLPFRKTGYTEEKWSGTNQTDDSKTKILCVIVVFAHHSVVNNNKPCVLVDLQGLVISDGSIILIDPQAHMCITFLLHSVLLPTHY